ncbi:DUF402 domain-containing protein [Mycoplasma phocoenae]|uniref:DUF402 domain-containing protein n=1 Tax=Mycoplasma phocoenae TaxID=754517 RepID=A0A858U6N9_9MOLU|nr:DUF402 domain-containing protein [Mycoplasma phocoenae]QJG66893.1 DUF402 domain-containing protein [Mycoplasma phocoenae]
MKNVQRKINKLTRGDFIDVQCYKYNGHLYRQYDGVKIIDITDKYVIALMLKTKVAEENTNWVVSEPTLFLFSKHHYYNATILLRDNQKFVYINLATPFFVDNNKIKYIDLDLDIKTYKEHEFTVIDWTDLRENFINMKYPMELVYKIYEELDFLYLMYNSREEIFNDAFIDRYINILRKNKDI